jgi:hypothetical protein
VRWFRLHARLILLAAMLALAGQGVVAFEAAFHRHDDTITGHKDGCTICAAVAQTGQPAEPPLTVAAHAPAGFVERTGEPRPAFIAPLSTISTRGPPSNAAI